MDVRSACAVALTLLAIVVRMLAVALCILVVVLCFAGAAAKLGIVWLVTDISRATPDLIAGYGVIASPFGGVFRLDFAVVALCLFILDYILSRVARALR